MTPAAPTTRVLRGCLVAVTALLAVVAGAGLTPPAAQAAAPTVVSLTFNDGLVSQYRNAWPVLQQHGMTGTFYVASNWVLGADAKYLRSYQLDELYRAGNEIGGMGKDHKNLTQTYSSDPSTDLAYKTEQVCGDRVALANLGYDPRSFSYPSGAEDVAAEGVVSGCGFSSGRWVGGLSAAGPAYAEPVPPANAFKVRTANLPAGAISLSTLQKAVTAASDHGGGWLPLTFNQVCDPADPGYSTCMSTAKPIDRTVLSSFLDWLVGGAPPGVSVATVRSVLGAPAQPPLPPRQTTVSLTFDDGLASQVRASSILADHGVAGTFYLSTGAIDAGEQGTLTWEQAHAMASAGAEIGGHTRDHVDLTSSSMSLEEKQRQVCEDRTRLEQEGFSPVSFAYPFAKFDSTAESVVKGCGYRSGRTGGTLAPTGPHYAETTPPKDPFGIRILGITDNGPTSLQYLQDAVDAVVDHGGGWLPTLFHQVCYRDEPSYDTCMGGYRPTDAATLEAFVSWLADQAGRGVQVRTVGQVMGGAG